MADISKITINGDEYNLKDAEARNKAEQALSENDNLLNQKADKADVDTELDKKANKYELCLKRNYIAININGDAKFNGAVCGTYNPETDELIYGVGDVWREGDMDSDGVDYWNFIEWENENDYLELPIEPITIKKGLYYLSMFQICSTLPITLGDYALYRYNEAGEIDSFLFDFIVEIGGYNLEQTDIPSYGIIDIPEDITVSSIKIKAKTPGMRMAEHVFEGVTDNFHGTSGRLVSSSEILEYIDRVEQNTNSYTLKETRKLREEKADKSVVENLETSLDLLESEIAKLSSGDVTLVDRTTQKTYKLYIDNGKLMIEESEV